MRAECTQKRRHRNHCIRNKSVTLDFAYHGIICSQGRKGVQVTFKQISREEYDSLSFQERLAYVERLQAEIGRQIADHRKKIDQMRKRLDRSNSFHSVFLSR